jgi:hypothetical protein
MLVRMSWKVVALLATLGLCLGCRPAPFAVATVVSWRPTKAEGRRCYHGCQSDWHACAASCGGGSTTVVVGVGPVAFGQTRSSAGCRHHCRHARTDCLRSCEGLEERVTEVRFCPHGPGHCEEPDPRSPKLQLPLYCRDRDGRLHPCGPD